MPKRICGAWLQSAWMRNGLRSPGLKHLAADRCKAPAVKTKGGAWRCPLHGGLSTGPTTPEGRERISAAQRRRWEAWRNRQAVGSPSTIQSIA